MNWELETGQTNDVVVYPNARGSGSNSLAMIEPYVGPEIQGYGYVPGLRKDDSGMVLMYLRTRTHYTWHADYSHTIFSPRRWMVVSTQVLHEGNCPEGGELLDTPEFKKRLQWTVDFLKEQQRPYWQVVAEEQTKFLNSIKD